jgi:hypothetical protein
MDTDKIKVFGARVKVESTAGLAEIERVERVRRSMPAHIYSHCRRLCPCAPRVQ